MNLKGKKVGDVFIVESSTIEINDIEKDNGIALFYVTVKNKNGVYGAVIPCNCDLCFPENQKTIQKIMEHI